VSETRWGNVRGEDLVELDQDGELATALPERAAIYLWKWSLRPRPADTLTPDSVVTWIDEAVSVPRGVATQVRASHFAWVNELELRAGSLRPDKRAALRRFAEKPGNRRWLGTFLEQLGAHTPALYAGETGHLPTRIRQHLRGESDFGALVEGHARLCWEKLELHYYDLGPPREGNMITRQTFEYIAAALTIAGYTSRPG
jgi:hypothetical protein